MRREPCQALLLDLDGVLRVFDPSHAAAVEQRHGLAAGAIAATAFERSGLTDAVTGRVSHDQWLTAVAEALAADGVPAEAARAAVAEWSSHRGVVRDEVLELVRELRAAGLPVAIATNATDWLDADLARLGLVGEVDAVVNSSVIRRCKPSADFFRAACEAVATPPAQCLFVDDDDRNVRGARAAGLSAYRYTDSADLRYVRAALRSAVA